MEQIARLWLRTQCRMMAGLCHAVVVLSPSDDDPEPRLAAVWPEDDPLHPALREASAHVLKNHQSVFRAGALPAADAEGRNADIIGCPVMLDGRVVGAVAMAVVAGDAARQRSAYHALKLGCAWFEGMVRAETTAVAGRLSSVLEIVGSTLEHPRFEAAAAALVNVLCARLECSRVSLGMLRGERVSLAAMSHSAIFEPGSRLALAITAAMQETVRRAAVVRCDRDARDARDTAHHRLVAISHDASVCSVPVTHDTRVLGVATLERAGDRPFSDDDVDVCEAALALAGPILELKQSRSTWLAPTTRATSRWRALPPALRHAAVAAVLVALVAFGCLYETDFRVTSPARLEGGVQRAVTAAHDGLIAEAPARAGDTVKAGELLVRLDDRDLAVEAQKWLSRRSQLEKEYRDALARHERARVSILRAEMAEAEAEHALATTLRERTRMAAPFDGVVVSGDLSQALGAPVERGQVLLEIAPLDGYRVVLEVDERDVAHVRAGQQGALVLSALPEQRLPLTVERVTPVASDDEGSHHFRVEAALEAPADALRPGMEGVAKLDIGRAPIAWTLTRRLRDWLRLTLWRWRP